MLLRSTVFFAVTSFPKSAVTEWRKDARDRAAHGALARRSTALRTQKKTPAGTEPAGADLKARRPISRFAPSQPPFFSLKTDIAVSWHAQSKLSKDITTGEESTKEHSCSTPVASFCIHLLRNDTSIMPAQFERIKRNSRFYLMRLLSLSTTCSACGGCTHARTQKNHSLGLFCLLAACASRRQKPLRKSRARVILLARLCWLDVDCKPLITGNL